jgi:hypothetical protein
MANVTNADRVAKLSEDLKEARIASDLWRRMSDPERVQYLVKVLRAVQARAGRAAGADARPEFILGGLVELVSNALTAVAAFETAEDLKDRIAKLSD